jgi:hypothetical protein
MFLILPWQCVAMMSVMYSAPFSYMGALFNGDVDSDIFFFCTVESFYWSIGAHQYKFWFCGHGCNMCRDRWTRPATSRCSLGVEGHEGPWDPLALSPGSSVDRAGMRWYHITEVLGQLQWFTHLRKNRCSLQGLILPTLNVWHLLLWKSSCQK